MQTNLTLTVDQGVLRTARKLALDHDTSVNQLVRDYLRHLTQQKEPQKATGAALREFFRTQSRVAGKRNWTRDDLYGRK